MTPRPRHHLTPLIVAAAVVALVGCGGDRGARAGAEAAAPTGAQAILIEGATIDWPANPSVAAVRMVVRNEAARGDALVEVTTPVAARTEIHRSEVDATGQVAMVEQARLELAARSQVTFEPAGLHVMLTGITADLQVGDEVPLELTFERAGQVTATATVVEPSLVGGDDHDH